MTRRRLLGIVAAVLLTLFGTVVLVAYVRSAEQRAITGQERVNALVVQERIAEGTPATEIGERVQVVPVPRNLRPAGAISSRAELDGQVAAVDLLPGEVLVSERFVERQEQGGEIPEGRQLIHLSLEPQRAAGGRLRAEQLVGVIVSLDRAEVPDPTNPEQPTEEDAVSGMLISKVPVVAVSGAASADAAAANALMVSLAVDETDAERIAFAAEHGRIWLTLQNDKTLPGGGRAQTRDTMVQALEEGS